ncbi:lamin tail domain-containing protein [Flexivirga caeni]|uniref:Lamin tail domain-containing protein n=1 Tax=Flexivirga caeni TaxID=2294115 RepID=A0A3M9M9M1_9MICO|nr:lamin tail domain-containing protein [Flexivirga caeni]RNI22271.1 lamin tail domain-containing protein [Flexivirga caeni]
MRRRASLLAASTVLAAGMALPFAAPAHAATTLKFAKFYFDQPGADTPYTQTRLNREYIQVKNVTRKTISMSGYLIQDAGAKHTFRFPSSFKLGAGKTVTVHTGKGKNTAANLYWGMTRSMIWNNTGDTATLKKGSAKVTSCSYKETAAQKKAKTGFKNC